MTIYPSILFPHITGVLSDVLNYDLLNAKGTAEVGGRGKTQEKMGKEAVGTVSLETGEEFECTSANVLVACFRFLKALTKNNIQVKRRCVMMIPILRMYSNVVTYSCVLDHVQVI